MEAALHTKAAQMAGSRYTRWPPAKILCFCEILSKTSRFNLSILSSGPVPDSPLEVCIGVSLDEGVDSVSLGGVVGDGLMVGGLRGGVPGSASPHSVGWMVALSLNI